MKIFIFLLIIGGFLDISTSESLSCIACQEEICTKFEFDPEFIGTSVCWCKESRYKSYCFTDRSENTIVFVGRYGIKVDYAHLDKDLNSSLQTDTKAYYVMLKEAIISENKFQIYQGEARIDNLEPGTKYNLCITSNYSETVSSLNTALDCLEVETRNDHTVQYRLAALAIGVIMVVFLVILFVVEFVLKVWYHRELRFYNVKTQDNENTEAVLFDTLETKLGMMDAREKIIFQKVKRAQKYSKKQRYGPIIARFTSPGQSTAIVTAAQKARANVVGSVSRNRILFKHAD